jgi:hypothetical protein
LVIGAALAAFEDFLRFDRIPAYRDLLLFVIPFRHFLATHLQSGALPLWNPWIYLGTPFLASFQTGVLYPPSLLLLLPFPFGFDIFLLAHFAIAATGFWLFLRERDLAAPACAVGSLTFALGGFLVSMINLTSHLQGAAWVPWAFLFWTRYLRREVLRDLALFICALVGLVLAGAPEIFLMAMCLFVGWTALAAPSGVSCVRSMAALGFAVSIALGVTAFQLLPTLEYVQQSDRSGVLPLPEVTRWSLQRISLLQLLLPRSVSPAAAFNPDSVLLEAPPPWIRSIYLGIVPLCFAIVGVCTGRERRFWTPVAVTAVVLAFGSAMPLLPALYGLLPIVFGKFRYPEKFYFLVHFAAAVLAAEGAQRYFGEDRRSERLAVIAGATLFAVVGALVLLRSMRPADFLMLVASLSGVVAPMTKYVPLAETLAARATRSLLVLGCFLGTYALRRASILSAPVMRLLTISLIAVDLASVAHGLNHGISWSTLQSTKPIVDVDALQSSLQRLYLYQPASELQAEPGSLRGTGLVQWHRFEQAGDSFEEAAVELWRIMPFDIPMVHGLGTLSGGDGIVRSSDNRLREEVAAASREGAVKLLRIFGVGALVGTVPLDAKELEGGAKAAGSSTVYVYRMREPVAAAYVATRVSRAATAEEAFGRMLEPPFEPGVDATVDALPGDWVEPSPQGGKGGQVNIQSWREEEIEMTVRAERPLLLVLNDSFYPGWSARVDDVDVTIRRANHLSRGVFVPRGEHRVVFVYRPRSFHTGIAISLASLLAATATIRVLHSKARRHNDL